jgi:hypothetical protein
MSTLIAVGYDSAETADAARDVSLYRPVLDRLIGGQAKFPEEVSAGRITVTADPQVLTTLLSLVDNRTATSPSSPRAAAPPRASSGRQRTRLIRLERTVYASRSRVARR